MSSNLAAIWRHSVAKDLTATVCNSKGSIGDIVRGGIRCCIKNVLKLIVMDGTRAIRVIVRAIIGVIVGVIVRAVVGIIVILAAGAIVGALARIRAVVLYKVAATIRAS